MRPKSAGAVRARIKAKDMQKQLAEAEHRERLRKLLTQKLTAKHGRDKQSQRAIRENVASFVNTRKQVNEAELQKLDRAVIDKVWPSARDPPTARSQPTARSPPTARSQPTARSPPTARSQKAQGSAVQAVKQQQAYSPSKIDRNAPQVIQEIDKHSKWKVLNAYSALQNEDFEASFVAKERAKKAEYRKILDEQMVIKRSKSTEADMRRQDEDFVKSQKLLLSEWRENMKVSSKDTKGRYLDQHKTRQLQAQWKHERLRKEFEATRAMEFSQIASNQLTIAANKKRAAEAVAEARRKNEAIVAQSKLDQVKKLERKKLEGDEDLLLMKQYKEKLRKQEVERKAKFQAVQDRLDAFAATQSEGKGGALYEKKQADLKIELQILKDAAAKDLRDAERDRFDKQQVKDKAKKMQQENLVRAAMKRDRERKEITDEEHYAQDFIRQSEDFMRSEKAKFDRIRQQREVHALELIEHKKLHKLKNKKIEMDAREYAVNKGLLADIYHDDKYIERLADRLKHGQKFTMKKSEEFKYKSNVM